MSTLRSWLDDAWPRHDKDARALADELQARAATLPDDDDGAETVRLARHVMVAHLDDKAAAGRFIAALPGGDKLAAQRLRAEWVLATVEGRPAPALADGVAFGLLADVAVAWLSRGRMADARQLMLDHEAAAAAHPEEPARRAFAAGAYNVALALRHGPRSAAHDALMIEMAELEYRAWSRAGTWINVERADYSLAMCHAVAGNGQAAQRHAAACLAACEANAADAAERFFAHECSVHAARAAGDAAAAAAHRARMQVLLAEVEDAGMKAWCEQTLAATPP